MQEPHLFSAWENQEAQATAKEGETKPQSEKAAAQAPHTEPITPLAASLREADRVAEDAMELQNELVLETQQDTFEQPNAAPRVEPTLLLETNAHIRLQSVARIMALGAARATRARRPPVATTWQAEKVL